MKFFSRKIAYFKAILLQASIYSILNHFSCCPGLLEENHRYIDRDIKENTANHSFVMPMFKKDFKHK